MLGYGTNKFNTEIYCKRAISQSTQPTKTLFKRDSRNPETKIKKINKTTNL